jgi:hypothetical protein
MLTIENRAELAETDVTRLRGVAGGDDVARMTDAMWHLLRSRGVVRTDVTTWPSGFVTKLQRLRVTRMFDAFEDAAVTAVVDELVGAGEWRGFGPWGPALLTFPQRQPWALPHRGWHVDIPARGDPDRPTVARLFGYINDVVPHGGGTLVVHGSHELVRRMVAASPKRDVGGSADLRRRLSSRHPWFRALCAEGGDRIRQFMIDGDSIDGVHVRVAELTGGAGDVAVMLPWTMHNMSMNCASEPRFMVTHSVYRRSSP